MAVINPEHLIEQAERLAKTPGRKPRQVDLRRAISSAYYAVFHALLVAAADEFVTKKLRGDPRYELVYRSIEHGAASHLCRAAAQTKPAGKYAPFLPRHGFQSIVRQFAINFVQLQIERHDADYNPSKRFTSNEAGNAIKLAKEALDALAQASKEDKVLFVTLLVFPPK